MQERRRGLGPDVVPAGLVVNRDGRVVQAAFQVAEDDVGLSQDVPDERERLLRVVDVPEMNVACEDESLFHVSLLASAAVACIIVEDRSGRVARVSPSS